MYLYIGVIIVSNYKSKSKIGPQPLGLWLHGILESKLQNSLHSPVTNTNGLRALLALTIFEYSNTVRLTVTVIMKPLFSSKTFEYICFQFAARKFEGGLVCHPLQSYHISVIIKRFAHPTRAYVIDYTLQYSVAWIHLSTVPATDIFTHISYGIWSHRLKAGVLDIQSTLCLRLNHSPMP